MERLELRNLNRGQVIARRFLLVMEGRKEQEYWNGGQEGTGILEWRVGRNRNIGMESLKEQ